MIDIPTFTMYIWPISDKICGRFSTQNCLFLVSKQQFAVLIDSDIKNMQQCLSGISFLECITLSGMIVSIPHAVVDGLIVDYFAVYFGNIWNFNLLRLTWRAFCHSAKPKMSKAIWRNLSQAVSFRGQNSGSPKLSTNGTVFWCVLYLLHPKFAQKENPKKLRPRRLVSTDSAALDAWSFRLNFHSK